MDSSGGAAVRNWSEEAEDLVHGGDIEGAVNPLESTGDLSTAKELAHEEYAESPVQQNACTHLDGVTLQHQESAEADDWEAAADRAPEELLSVQSLQGVSKLSLEDSETKGIRRRGRGTFSYKNRGLYSDDQVDEQYIVHESDESIRTGSADDTSDNKNPTYGTSHVLVLADFIPSTRTTDLEKSLERLKDQFVIRWVNDTTALAVFRTPSTALEARNSIKGWFNVRLLDEADELLSSIPPKDLEPPRQRPQTCVRTARRLIAHGMGIKLPSTVGSTKAELTRQKDDRRNRIVSRQNMRDDAWGGE